MRSDFPHTLSLFLLQARRSVAVYAAARPLWQPGGTAPAHLDGSLPGDYGFDPLNLGANAKALDWCVI